MLIVHELLDAPKRFCELERALTGISTRTLSSKLEILTETGLLCKIDEHYTLTEKGKGLRGIERAMRAYGTKYLA
jgi:DNA-binding HxlR family transcriptional regulator